MKSKLEISDFVEFIFLDKAKLLLGLQNYFNWGKNSSPQMCIYLEEPLEN